MAKLTDRELEEGLAPLKRLFEEEKRQGAEPKPSPFMRTRVLARLREGQQKTSRSTTWIWQAWSALSTSALALLILLNLEGKGPDFKAPINTSLVVDVELRAMTEAQVAYVEISLPEGVYFHSTTRADVRGSRSLVVNWKDRPGASDLPFIIRAEQSGVKSVMVSFYDASNNLIEKREMKIGFGGEGS